MSAFEWLEMTGFAKWVGESLYGYPLMISLHAIGLATVVGILVLIDLRVLGAFPGMPYRSLRAMMKLAWLGVTVNLLSGFGLFSAQASFFATNQQFLIKIGAVFLALLIAAAMQFQLVQSADRWDGGNAVSGSARAFAALSIALLALALVAGRLIAYFK